MPDDSLADKVAELNRRERALRSRRTPDTNHPYAPIPVRAERRTGRSYRDPVGDRAAGRADGKTKNR